MCIYLYDLLWYVTRLLGKLEQNIDALITNFEEKAAGLNKVGHIAYNILY